MQVVQPDLHGVEFYPGVHEDGIIRLRGPDEVTAEGHGVKERAGRMLPQEEFRRCYRRLGGDKAGLGGREGQPLLEPGQSDQRADGQQDGQEGGRERTFVVRHGAKRRAEESR